MRPCPRCDYDLSTLPAIHKCPECGLDYDPPCKVIRYKPSRFAQVATLLGILVIGSLVIMGLRNRMLKFQSIINFLWFPIMTTPIILWWLRGRRAAMEIIINRHGVRFARPGEDGRFIPWKQINSVEWRGIPPRLVIRDNDQNTVFSISRFTFASPGIETDCVNEIYRLKIVYQRWQDDGDSELTSQASSKETPTETRP